MSSFSDKSIFQVAAMLMLAATLLMLTGCMADNPNETDMPWAAPAGWEGTMPLPGGYFERY